MGLLATNSGLIQTVPLCEIEAFNRLEGFGIFCTIRVVGRAQLLEIQQQEPYIRAVCTELVDSHDVVTTLTGKKRSTTTSNTELHNLVASHIENLMLNLSSMEHRLTQAKKEQKQKRLDEDPRTDGSDDDDDDDDDDDMEMQRRINIAKLVRTAS